MYIEGFTLSAVKTVSPTRIWSNPDIIGLGWSRVDRPAGLTAETRLSYRRVSMSSTLIMLQIYTQTHESKGTRCESFLLYQSLSTQGVRRYRSERERKMYDKSLTGWWKWTGLLYRRKALLNMGILII